MKKTSVSKRIELSQNSKLNGFCLICGTEGKLTKDHVPPTNSLLTIVDSQKTAVEFFSREGNVKPQRITTGNYSRTLCSDCNNNVLGSLDSEIGIAHKMLSAEILKKINNKQEYNDAINVPVNISKYMRAMVGHIISALPSFFCSIPLDTPLYTPLRNFVLGDESGADNFEFYYWFFPMNYQMVINNFAFEDLKQLRFTSGSIISFYPISFMIVDKSSEKYNNGYSVAIPPGAVKMELADDALKINLSSWNDIKTGFPYTGINEYELLILNEDLSFITYKK
ncbi:hypothetical protein [Pectobacterium brasiliense]|uniref:hypothetical protein n=1 Tax=Pectobacterium brasiliense TaxID=180957 RepID=UPI0015DD6899|nr:hypothetical protein [Pectobacterium brasiliense]MBA0208555.1 hypothetical protein [Pectobacterium brasiliense]